MAQIDIERLQMQADQFLLSLHGHLAVMELALRLSGAQTQASVISQVKQMNEEFLEQRAEEFNEEMNNS